MLEKNLSQARGLLLCLSALLLFPCAALAQKFSGSLEGSGAWNFAKNNSESAVLKLNYDAPKWYLHTSFYGGHSYVDDQNVTKMSLTASVNMLEMEMDDLVRQIESGEMKKVTYDEKGEQIRSGNWGGDIDLGFNWKKVNHLNFSIGYSASASNKVTYTTSTVLSAVGETAPYSVASKMGMLLQADTCRTDRIKAFAGYVHDFAGEFRKLSVKVSSQLQLDYKSILRALINVPEAPFYANSMAYKAPSSLNSLNVSFDANYSDGKRFLGVEKLRGTVGMGVNTGSSLDYFKRLNIDNGVLRDSTELSQCYDYQFLALEPYADLTYTAGKFDIHAYDRVQRYSQVLYSAVGGAEVLSPTSLDNVSWGNMAKLDVTFRIAPRHSLKAQYSRELIRPSYEKLTDMVKISDTEGEFYTGNPSLAPQKNDLIYLKYTYRFKRFFEAYASLQYKVARDKAEKVVSEKAEGVTYYTYVNAGLQRTPSLRLDLKCDWKHLKAEIYAQANMEIISYKDISKEGKTTFNWEVMGNVSYDFPKGWRVSASGGYSSPKDWAFNRQEMYVKTSARISKTFFDRLDVYLEGRDLADREIWEYTWSENLDYMKATCTVLGRRAIALGLKYKF